MKKLLKNLSVWAVALITAGLMISCEKDESFPSVDLSNQIWYENSTISVSSAAYVVESGNYTVYLSPTPGLTTVQAIQAATDCLVIKSGNPNGEQTSATVSYKGSTLKSSSVFNMTMSNNVLDLEMKVVMTSGEKLMAKYYGSCPEAVFYPELANQVQNDETVKSLGSFVAEHNFSTEMTTYYVYEEADVTSVDQAKTPAITIVAPLGTDLSSAEVTGATVTVVGSEAVSGTLVLVLEEDKVGGTQSVDLTIEAADASGNLLRAKFGGIVAVTGKSDNENSVKTTVAEQTTEVALTAVYAEEATGSYKLVFGTKSDATTVAELMAENNYAFELTVSANNLKEGEVTSVDLASVEACGFKVYDYTKYTYWDNSRTYEVSQNDVISGSVKLAKLGNELFVDLEAELGVNELTPHAMDVTADWYGAVTAEEIPDMTPVAPVTNMFQVLNEDGSTIFNNYYRNITSVQVAKVESETVSGGTYAADYYYFYLVNNDTQTNGINSRNGTPRIRIRKEYLGKEIDLAAEAQALLAIEAKGYPSYGQTAEQLADIATACTTSWEVYYSNYGFTSSKFGNPAPKAISSAWPAVGTVKVDFDETTKKATITLKVQNLTYATDYSTGKHALGKGYSDTKRWFEVTFDGTCVKYEGKGGSTGFSSSSSTDSLTW